jgi:carbamoylphosphate synthase large subunit
MPNVNMGVRAKCGYIEVERRDKMGRIVKARQHVVPSQGMYSADEMHREMLRIAAEVGADESQVRVETYEKGAAPLEVNPRHRGPLRRQYWSGWSPT